MNLALELPAGWCSAAIGDLSDRAQQRVPARDDQFSYIDISSVDRQKKAIVEPQRISGATAPSRARQVVRAGDVLVSMTRPNLNAVAIVPAELDGEIASTGFDVLRPVEIDGRWLLGIVKTAKFVTAMTDLVQGALYPAVRPRDVRGFELPLAPLNEQKRIADKLDTLLARVDACRERLDRVPTLLKRFRQSVLAAATSGALTADWREERGADDGTWEPATLAEMLESKPRNGYSPHPVEYPTRVKSLTLTATTSGRFKGEHFKYIDETIAPSSHLWLHPGDILIQRANTMEYVGISAVYDGPPGAFIYPDLMMKCRANARVDTSFLHFVLLSEPVRRYFRENATGTAGNMPKINQQTVLSAPGVIPSLDEQREIAARAGRLFAHADRVEASYAAARTHTERLTPALLAKAFRGELVPQDPNDEPASVLLERIRAARAPEPKPAKSRRPARAASALQFEVLDASEAPARQPLDAAGGL